MYKYIYICPFHACSEASIPFGTDFKSVSDRILGAHDKLFRERRRRASDIALCFAGGLLESSSEFKTLTCKMTTKWHSFKKRKHFARFASLCVGMVCIYT